MKGRPVFYPLRPQTTFIVLGRLMPIRQCIIFLGNTIFRCICLNSMSIIRVRLFQKNIYWRAKCRLNERSIFYRKIKGSLFENAVSVNSKGWVYSINSTINYQITPTFSTQFNLSYLSARNTAQGEDSRFYQPNFSIKKSFLKINCQFLHNGKMQLQEI